MKRNVIYNNNIVWGSSGTPIMGNQPTPFFSKSIEYIQAGERWCQAENWTLNGVLTGCNFQDLELEKNKLLNAFSSAFGSMNILIKDPQINEDDFWMPVVEVRDINFDDSDYIGNLGYSISFLHYPENSFSGVNHSGFYGVINPSDNITYTENDNGILEMSREISAKGIMTDLNKNTPLNNAKNFIEQRKNILPKPFLIKNQVDSSLSDFKYYLVSSEESFNRLTNEIRLTQTYRSDLLALDGSVTNRYTISEDENLGQLTIISYQGEINAGKYGSITKARNLYENFKNSLNFPFLLSENVTEDLYINKITYSLNFYKNVDSNNFQEIEDDFRISFTESPDSSLFSASIQGNIKPNYGCLAQRLNKVKNFYSSLKNTKYNFSLINNFYDKFYSTSLGSKQNKPSEIILSINPSSESYDLNEYDNVISYSAEFNDRYIPAGSLGQCDSYNENVSINYAIPQKSIKEYYKGGKYICQNLGYNNRESVSAQISRDGVKSFVSENTYKSVAIGIVNNFKKQDASKQYEESPSYSKNEIDKTDEYSITLTYNTKQGFS